MALSVCNDPSRPAGGHALLEGPGLGGVAALTIENVTSGLFLAPDGRWAKRPHAFPVAPSSADPASLSLGPDIVDRIPSDLRLRLRGAEGGEIGTLFWSDIVPSRGMPGQAAPAPSVPPPGPSKPPVPPGPVPSPPSGPLPSQAGESQARGGSRRRPLALVLAGSILAALAVGLTIRHRPAGGPRDCAAAFAARLAALDGAAEGARVTLAQEAIEAGCGAQAFGALDGADWRADEPASWYLARFYDPNEIDPVFHQTAIPHPAWAALYYATWALRSPRQADALKRLCAAQGAAFDDVASVRRACGR